jgi:tetratricopeptide (TPR) repeat protein
VSPGRNDLCPCGSQKKFKKCCGQPGAGSALNQAMQPGRPTAAHGVTRSQAHAPFISPDPSQTEINQCIELFNSGRPAELEARMRGLMERHPNSGFVWHGLGVALQAQGKDALAALQRSIELLPHDPFAHFNLGNALRDVGRLNEAMASYRHALAINPHFAEAHDNLGNILAGLGRFADASASYQRAIAIKPDFAQAYNNLGAVLWNLGNHADALACYQRALAIVPDYAEVHYNVGNTLKDIGLFDQAAASYRRALQLKPNDAATLCNLGIVLRLQAHPIEAEAMCREALAIEPDLLAAITLMAELRADQGQFSEVEQLYLRAISIDPESPEAWAGIARSRKMTNGDAAWLSAAQRIVASGLPPRQEVPLRYAIGKYYDDVRDYANAFLNYQRANELSKLFAEKYNRHTHEQTVDKRIQLYSSDWLARHTQVDNTSARPIFIVGMPRSGTTLAEQILASHPAIFGAGELPFWVATATQFETSHNDAPMGVENIAPALQKMTVDYGQLLDRISPDKLRIVDKMPSNFLQLGLIHAAFPHARIIHMKRNPIDTCLSIYFQRFFETVHPYANDLEDLAHYYTEYERIMQHWHRTLPANTILDVCYEELVADQESWSRTMLEFIGVPWDARCLDFHQSVRTVSTTSNWQVRQKISSASVERWRNYEQFVVPLQRLLSAAAPLA